MKILGVSAFYHDSSAAIIVDGKIIACAQEERFTRIKHDQQFPINSIIFCLEYAGLKLSDLDNIVFYEKPFLKFERLLESYLATAPLGFKSFSKAIPLWIKEKLFQKKLLIDSFAKISKDADIKNKLLFSEHHISHAASAFFPSPFKESLVLTMDGVGEWATSSVCIAKDNQIELIKEINFPHSLGLLYSAFTYYLGFKVNSGEYKVMGLAPYGSPIYTDIIKNNLIDIKEDGSFRLNMKYFDYCSGLKMINRKFENLFNGKARSPEDQLTQREMDLAASLQDVTEQIMLKIARSLRREFGIPNLCLAGGVALNCVANGKIVKENIFDNVWVQPAAGDAGGSLGAALYAYYAYHKKTRIISNSNSDDMQGSYLGPAFSNADIKSTLDKIGAEYELYEEDEFITSVSNLISQNKVIGWFQGRMEFGPRALGSRSILANPCDPNMQKNLNLKIKYRESFRPFAPVVLEEDVNEWFDFNKESPYMLMVAQVKDDKLLPSNSSHNSLFGIDKLNVVRSKIPAVTHVDNSARIQTVSKKTNPMLHKLISLFKKITGCPVLINTSFNIRGEPIVCTPEDAFRCFMGTEMDILAIGNFILYKDKQKSTLIHDYRNAFELD